MTQFTTAKELATHFRSFLQSEGIKARCRITRGGGGSIQVFPPAYGTEFTEEEQRVIRSEAVKSGLTFVRGLAIDVERMTDPRGMELFF